MTLLGRVPWLLAAGQAGDNPQLVPLLDAHDAARTADSVGKDTFRLLADKAHSHPSDRQRLRALDGFRQTRPTRFPAFFPI